MKKKSAKGTASSKEIHPWRICPAGEHWVRIHPLHMPPSEKNPVGTITTRRGHCARNPTGKDQLYPDEIQEIGERNFPTVKVKPCPIGFEFGKKGTQYDDLIAGWTKYWNDILKPDIPLEPNTVKALIATESGFDPKILANKKDQDSARGLMQITNSTRKILGNEKGELKDHFLTLTREDLNDPSNNICAGIRWLFRKRAIAADLQDKNVSWDEAVAEFKGARTTTKERASELMGEFNQRLESLKKMRKNIIFLFLFFYGIYGFGYSRHLNELKETFPFGLLTDDFGVLNQEDLKINACVADAVAFSEDSHSYPYWQCFDSGSSQLNCEGRKYDPYEKSRMTLLIVSAKVNGNLHEYLYRRTMPLKECHLFQKEWRRLLKGQKYVCVSGPFISVKKNKNGRTWSWVFDRYKTKKGWDGSYLGKCMPNEKSPL